MPRNKDRQGSVSDLVEKSDLVAEVLCPPENQIDLISHELREANRLLAVNNFFRMGENYRRGELYLRCGVSFGQRHDCDLIFAAEVGRCGYEFSRTWPPFWEFQNSAPSHSDRDQDSVFFDVCEVVQDPEGVVPSFVWIVRPEKRNYLYGQAVFYAVYEVEPLLEVRRDREVGDCVGSGMARGDGVSHLVQTGSQVVHCIEHYAGGVFDLARLKADLENVLSKIRIVFNERFVWSACPENMDGPLQILDMMVCAPEDRFGAGERIGHGQKHS